MKKTKKNNKGFSLVELIVVVLIMAIIAVALAPQVMKWVGNSKVSADVSNYDSLVSNIQTALTYDDVRTAVAAAAVTVTFDTNGVTCSNTNVQNGLKKVCGMTFDSNVCDSIKAKVAGASYSIIINKDATLDTSDRPDGSGVTTENAGTPADPETT